VAYSSSLSDLQWNTIASLFSEFGLTDDKLNHSLRTIINGILYIVNNGVKWRELPNDFPPWQTVYYHFAKWSKGALWESLNHELAEMVRTAQGREASPSLVSIDSQSLGGEPGIEDRGIDGNKKVNGRKRHIAVDVNGIIFACGITPANESDVHMGATLVEQLNKCDKFTRLAKILGDNAYSSVGNNQRIPVTIEARERAPGQRGFVPEAYRWVVERTFSWLNRQRRLVRNYEKKISYQKAMTLIGGIRICLAKLERQNNLSQSLTDV
jgi:putative transposase